MGTYEIGLGDQSDWFRISLVAGVFYEFTCSHVGSSSYYPGMELYIQDFTSIKNVTAEISHNNPKANTLRFTPQYNGVYFIHIHSYGGYYSLLYISRTPPTPTPDPNMTPTPTFTPISPPSDLELNMISEEFSSQLLYSIDEELVGLGINAVVGENDDLVAIVRDGAGAYYLKWYSPGETKIIAKSRADVSISGLLVGSQKSLLVIIKNISEQSWKVLRINGPFHPTHIQNFYIF